MAVERYSIRSPPPPHPCLATHWLYYRWWPANKDLNTCNETLGPIKLAVHVLCERMQSWS